MMKLKVHYRKGAKNKKFKAIVEEVVDSLKKLPNKGRLKSPLLGILEKGKSVDSSGWQDGDKLRKLLGDSEHRFDLYNWRNQVAIEIEQSEVKYVWKDLVKFSIGARRRRVKYAILICPLKYGGKNMKTSIKIYDQAIKHSHFMADLLWVKNLAILGYE